MLFFLKESATPVFIIEEHESMKRILCRKWVERFLKSFKRCVSDLLKKLVRVATLKQGIIDVMFPFGRKINRINPKQS